MAKQYSRILYDLRQNHTYHIYSNCPSAEKIGEFDRRISTEAIARKKGMVLCKTCPKMEENLVRPDDLPGGLEVEPVSKIGVSLSGGGHRATLFGLGVLMYLTHAHRDEEMSVNNDVFEISSVSGGSITNGFIAQELDYQSATANEFDEAASRLATQIAQHGTIFAPLLTRVYVGFLVLLSICVLVGFVGFFFFRGSWNSFWYAEVGITITMLITLGVVVQLRGSICERGLAQTLFSPKGIPTKISDVARKVLHVICATEIQTGNAVYFSPHFIFCENFESRHPEDLQLVRAVRASAALPVAFPPCPLQVDSKHLDRALETLKGDPCKMVLVDGGVRDNLGADWYTDPVRRQNLKVRESGPTLAHVDCPISAEKTIPCPIVNEMVVVSAASNRVKPSRLSPHRPIFGELSSILKLSDLPYYTREYKSRRALRWRFASAPNLQYQDGRLGINGVILHIEESPCELAEDLALWKKNWNTSPSQRDDGLNFDWFDRNINASGTVETVDLLDWSVLRNATGRAEELLDVIANAEEEEDLERLAREYSMRMSRIRKELNLSEQTSESLSKRKLASLAWSQRAAANAGVSTNLSALGVETSAALIRHGFVLAMAKLHLLMGYPMCEIPSAVEFERLATGDSTDGCDK